MVAGKIVRKKIPPNYKIKRKSPGAWKPSIVALTKSGALYSPAMERLGNRIYYRVPASMGTKRAAMVSFCRNYFVRHQELPSFSYLQKMFPELR